MRRVSGLERIWLAARRVAPPFANQLVLEGRGWPEPPQGWDALLAALAEAQPGARLRLRGALGGMRWSADGPLPAVRELDGSAWDGASPAGAPFLDAPIDPWRGPILEILLLRGTPARVVLRSLNAATDGTGMLLHARGLCALLRGEAPPRASAGPEQDEILAREIGALPVPPPPQDCAALTGRAVAGLAGCTWRRLRLPARPHLLPALALALAAAAEGAEGRPLRVEIPVDLRRWAPGLQSTANLSAWMPIPVHLHLGAEDPLASLHFAIRDGLQRKAAASAALGAGFARGLPLWLLAWLGRRMAATGQREDRYGCSAVLSHLGHLDPAELSGGGFVSERAWFVPPGGPGQPAFLTTTVGPEGVELCAAMPAALASDGRIEAFLDRMRRALLR